MRRLISKVTSSGVVTWVAYRVCGYAKLHAPPIVWLQLGKAWGDLLQHGLCLESAMADNGGLSHVMVLRSIAVALRVTRQPCSVKNGASARAYCRVTEAATFVVYHRKTSSATVSSSDSVQARIFTLASGPGVGWKADDVRPGR